MMRIRFVFIFTICVSFLYSQENTKHIISFSAGNTAYKTSFSMPSGISGKAFSILYDYNKSNQDKNNRIFYLSTRASFSHYKYKNVSTDLNYPYLHYAINVDLNWLWKVYKYQRFQVFLGAGVGLDAYCIYSNLLYSTQYFLTPYGNWGISAKLSTKITYAFKKFYLSNIFKLPAVKYGHFPLYQTFGQWNDNEWKYSLAPNTIAWTGNYCYIDNTLRATIPYKDVGFSLSYFLLYQHSKVNQNEERYLLHAIGVGVNF